MNISGLANTPRAGSSPGFICVNQVSAGFQSLIEKELKKVSMETHTNTYSGQTPLTSEDIAELAAKYNPLRMTSAQYDSFLEDLVDKGVLDEEGILELGYRGCIVFTPGEGGGVSFAPKTSFLPPRIFNLEETNGNALMLVRMLVLWKPVPESSDAYRTAENRKNAAYTTMANIFEAMQRVRACGAKIC